MKVEKFIKVHGKEFYLSADHITFWKDGEIKEDDAEPDFIQTLTFHNDAVVSIVVFRFNNGWLEPLLFGEVPDYIKNTFKTTLAKYILLKGESITAYYLSEKIGGE